MLPVEAVAESVAVFPVVSAGGVSPEHTRAVTGALVDELGERPGLSATRVDLPTAGGRRRARPAGAASELREGKRLSERLRIPQAIAKLERGLELYRADPASLSDFGSIVESHLLLAEAHLRRGKEDAGREVLATLARIQPWIEIDEARYPPLFVNLWKEMQAREVAKPRGALVLRGDPGTVSINGKRLGSIPLRVEQLIVGEHHVVVQGSSGVFGKTVSVRQSRDVEVDVSLAGAPASGLAEELRSNRTSEVARTRAIRAAEAAGARYALIGVIARGDGVYDLGLLLGDSVTGEWTRLRPLVLDTELLSTSIEANKAAREVARRIAEPGAPMAGTVDVIQGSGPVAGASEPPAGELRTVSFYGAPAGVAPRSLDPRDRAPIETVVAQGEGIPPPAEVSDRTDGEGGSIVGEWWFWTAVGVVALGAAGGAYFAFIHDRPADGVSVEAVW